MIALQNAQTARARKRQELASIIGEASILRDRIKSCCLECAVDEADELIRAADKLVIGLCDDMGEFEAGHLNITEAA